MCDAFDRVVDQGPAERDRAIAEMASVDPEMAQEVTDLIQAMERKGGAVEGAIEESFRALLDDEEGESIAQRRLGPYRMIREIGRGGMGAVYEAERQDEFRKRVAIKLIPRGMHSELAVRRFVRERQILAALEHPHIARLLDGGVTSGGRPYLVMEYVEGQPLPAWCDARRLDVEARLRIFLDVCDAVGFAHRNLVVHRDVKPSNVLVTGDGEVKLLDFGIASLLEDGAEDEDPLTVPGGLPLTPGYASPEQLRGEPVTTVSDVWSLGVVLYELLTGVRPFPRASGAAAPALETEPTRPSAAVTAEAAGARRADPSRLRRQLTGDLDAIVLMALRKEPERRYHTVEALAQDITRRLENQPVLAAPDSAGYRLRKFVHRHRVTVAGAALLLGAIVLGAAGTAWQARRADVARDLAERRFHDVRGLAQTLMFEVHDAVADLPGSTPAREIIVRRGLAYLDSLQADVGADPTLRREIGEAYVQLGRIQGHPHAANLGDREGARASFENALSVLAPLVDGGEIDPATLRTVALAHESLADLEAWTGNPEGGVDRLRNALAIRAAVARAAPGNVSDALAVAIGHVKLADLLGHPAFPNLDEWSRAVDGYDRAQLIVDSLPGEPAVRRYRGLVQERMGGMLRGRERYAEALPYLERSFAVRESLSQEDPAQMSYLRDVAVGHQLLCEVQSPLGRVAEAVARCRRAVADYERLRAADPLNVQTRMDVGLGLQSLGDALAGAGRAGSAVAELERSNALMEELHRPDSTNVQIAARLFYGYRRAVELHSALSRAAGDAAGRAAHRRSAGAALDRARASLQDLEMSGVATTADREALAETELELARRTP